MVINFVIGLLLLFIGGELVVRAILQIASRLRLSPFFISLSVLAIATSLPEAATSMVAQLRAPKGSIALGNVIGSNIANTGLILAVALFFGDCPVSRQIRFIRMPIMGLVAFLVWGLLFLGPIKWGTGIVLLLLLCGYLGVEWYRDQVFIAEKPSSSRWSYLLLIIALGCLFGGADRFVVGAIGFAHHFHVSDRVIGITLVALGTSLPELATVIAASIKKRADLVLGSIIGSNIFNTLFIIPLAAFIHPVYFPKAMAFVDAGVMAFFAFLVVVFAFVRSKLSWVEGAILFILYCGYIFYLY